MSQQLTRPDINFTRNTFDTIIQHHSFAHLSRFKEILPKLDNLLAAMTDHNLTEVVLADRIQELAYLAEIKQLREEVISAKETIAETIKHAKACCDFEMSTELDDRLASLSTDQQVEAEKDLDEERLSYTPTQPANQSLNNGGETNYYDLPPESSRPCIDDLIEFKKMQRWQAEIFKSSYAIEDRAKRATDGSSSEVRELNKMAYYLNRRLKQLGEEVYKY